MSNNARLDVIVVGSGMAGLAAAGILREHHNVTVYERGDLRIATGGQGLIISPFAVKTLESIGYSRGLAGAVPILGLRLYSMDGAILEDVPLRLNEKFGDDILAHKRSDFRTELLRLATADPLQPGIRGSPVKVILNTAVTDVSPDEGRVRLSDGSQSTADLVIVADGIHSHLRKAVIGNDEYNVEKTGLTCYRIDVPTELAKQALGELPLPPWWTSIMVGDSPSMNLIMGSEARVVAMYPIRNRSYINFSLLVKTIDSTRDTTESWHADGDLNNVLTVFGDFPEALRKILSVATEVKEWELQELRDIPTWTRGRTILIGDAAHAMTPMQGQGANMAIEDAESLRLFVPGTRHDDVPALLKLAGEVRRHRLAQVSDENRNANTEFSSVAERMDKNKDLYYGYGGINLALKAYRDNLDI
ncbi:FAD binding domain protein [Thozetella sp. PMI_491]|nr:FAD binding domain protein [Thozetella sp. PMI_491]